MNAGLTEMKLSLLEHRMHLIESENLRLSQESLRFDQAKLSDMQNNLERMHSQMAGSCMLDSRLGVNQGNSSRQPVERNVWVEPGFGYMGASTQGPHLSRPVIFHNQGNSFQQSRDHTAWINPGVRRMECLNNVQY